MNPNGNGLRGNVLLGVNMFTAVLSVLLTIVLVVACPPFIHLAYATQNQAAQTQAEEAQPQATDNQAGVTNEKPANVVQEEDAASATEPAAGLQDAQDPALEADGTFDSSTASAGESTTQDNTSTQDNASIYIDESGQLEGSASASNEASSATPLAETAPVERDLTITGGQENTDYTYADGVLTILTGTALTVSTTENFNSGAPASDRIVINTQTTTTTEGSEEETTTPPTANLTFSGVYLSRSTSPIYISDNNSLNLTLADSTSSTLRGNANYVAGITGGTNASLVINGSGALDVYGYSPTYGSSRSASAIDLTSTTINDGTVKVDGGTDVADIAGNLTITGGYINAVNGNIGSASTTTITGGYFAANSGAVNDGRIYGVSLPSGYMDVENTDTATATDYPVQVVKQENATGAFDIQGGTLGADYTWESGVLTILTDKELTISNLDSTAAVNAHIVVDIPAVENAEEGEIESVAEEQDIRPDANLTFSGLT